MSGSPVSLSRSSLDDVSQVAILPVLGLGAVLLLRDSGGRERIARTRTDADGEFDVTVDLTGPPPDETDQEYDRRAEGPVREETYRAQAYTIGATNAAETTSNVVHYVRERGEVELDPRRRPSSGILRWLGTVRNSVSGVFSRFTGNDDTVRCRRREPLTGSTVSGLRHQYEAPPVVTPPIFVLRDDVPS